MCFFQQHQPIRRIFSALQWLSSGFLCPDRTNTCRYHRTSAAGHAVSRESASSPCPALLHMYTRLTEQRSSEQHSQSTGYHRPGTPSLASQHPPPHPPPSVLVVDGPQCLFTHPTPPSPNPPRPGTLRGVLLIGKGTACLQGTVAARGAPCADKSARGSSDRRAGTASC